MGQDLDPEQLAMARGAGLGIGERASAKARQLAMGNEDYRAIVRDNQVEQKVRQQEERAKILATVAVTVNQQLDTKVSLDATSVAKQLADAVIPAMHKLMEDTKRALEAEARKQRDIARGNANAPPRN